MTAARPALHHGWQAEQRAYRDLLMTCVLLLTFALYVYKTVPLLCAMQATDAILGQGQQPVRHASAKASSNTAWRLVCGRGVEGQAVPLDMTPSVHDVAQMEWLLPWALQVGAGSLASLEHCSYYMQ